MKLLSSWADLEDGRSYSTSSSVQPRFFIGGWHMVAIVFTGGLSDHDCSIPEHLEPTDHLIPGDDPYKCSIYKNISVDNSTIACPYGYNYTGDVGSTIVTEWDLVCQNSFMKDSTQTVMIIGVMVGAMLFSTLSDRYGRKPVFLFSQWAMIVVGVATAFVNNYYGFVVLRFFAGALQQGIVLTGFVMACELFPAHMRTFAGLAIENFWALGLCILSLLAYLIRDWRHLQIAITLPGILTIVFYWILPESVPWLVANDKVEDAEEILQKAAKFNKVTMPRHILLTEEQGQAREARNQEKRDEHQNHSRKERLLLKLRRMKGDDKKEEHNKEKQTEEMEDPVFQKARYTLMDVLRHPKLRMYAIIMCCLWFVNSLVYYGLTLSTSALAGDRYLNFFLSSLVEIPAYTICMFVLQRWGRRRPLVAFHIIAGVGLIAAIAIQTAMGEDKRLQPLVMTLSMIGKFGITGSFGTVFLYAPEIFPTTLRNQAMGISSLGGRLGNMLAPFASLLAKYVSWMPGVIFGVLSILVGILVMFLPETLNRPLPTTIEDIENWSKLPQDHGAENHDATNHEMKVITDNANDAKAENSNAEKA